MAFLRCRDLAQHVMADGLGKERPLEIQPMAASHGRTTSRKARTPRMGEKGPDQREVSFRVPSNPVS